MNGLFNIVHQVKPNLLISKLYKNFECNSIFDLPYTRNPKTTRIARGIDFYELDIPDWIRLLRNIG